MEIINPALETFCYGDTVQAGSPPEAKVAKDLAREFIYKKIGRPLKVSPRKECEVLIRLSDEIEIKHEMLLKNMCNRLNITSENAYKTFSEISEEVFKDDCNWGRIVILYSFGGKLAIHCSTNNMDAMVDRIVNWLGSTIARKAPWIKAKGGWNNFMEHFKDVRGDRDTFWFQSLLATTLGLGTLAAAFYIKG